MDKPPKADVLGVGVSVTDYHAATALILSAAERRESMAGTALAVHGVMECVDDPELARLVNELELVTPDGQPVRWGMRLLGGPSLHDRVTGPDLMEKICAEAARRGVSVYLYGSTPETCDRLVTALLSRFPDLDIAGVQPDRFREATPEEDAEDVARMNASGAGVVFVGRGCPRQERWVATHRGRVHAAMLAVGAAFDYHAGTLRRAPRWMQRAGLEWLYRLCQEPQRLLGRYLRTNTRYAWRVGRSMLARRR